MFIGIDAREIQDGVRTGIGRALAVFLHSTAGATDRYVLFSNRAVPESFGEHVTNMLAPQTSVFVWDQRTLVHLIRVSGVELFVSPYYKIPLLSPVPCVSMIFDLMYLTAPMYRHNLGPMSRWYYQTVGRLMVHRARRIITCSEYSRREIMDVYGVSAARISVVPLGLGAQYRPPASPDAVIEVCDRLGIQALYILYVGSFKPHKNSRALLDAFELLAPRFPAHQLVFAGAPDSAGERLRMEALRRGLASRVRFTGFIDVVDQVALYGGAAVVVVPSLVEGFGYPALEAMGCGAALVCSERASLPEVAGDAALYCDPADPAAMAGRIGEVIDKPQVREALRARGVRQAARFSEGVYGTAMRAALAEALCGALPGAGA